jgi:putative ABC transport system ATP-binding protein
MADSVMGLLAEIDSTGTTIIMVTHELTLATRAQRNIFVRDGSVSDGPGDLQLAAVAS